MHVRIRVNGHSDLLSLREWLAREPEFRGRIDLETSPIEPGQMGTVSDVLIVGLGAGGAVSVLASSLRVWLEQRHSDVTIEVANEDGRSVKITANRVPDAAELVREVLREQTGEQ